MLYLNLTIEIISMLPLGAKESLPREDLSAFMPPPGVIVQLLDRIKASLYHYVGVVTITTNDVAEIRMAMFTEENCYSFNNYLEHFGRETTATNLKRGYLVSWLMSPHSLDKILVIYSIVFLLVPCPQMALWNALSATFVFFVVCGVRPNPSMQTQLVSALI